MANETAIVLATHGAPPNDFPRPELSEFFALHARIEQAGPGRPPQTEEWLDIEERHSRLEAKMRAWPRTAVNDPFHAGSSAIAQALATTTGMTVVLGFNEFCAPSMQEALDTAALEARRVIVVTPMLTPGGGHAGDEIPAEIERARVRHRRTEFLYAWPFEPRDVAEFLAAQAARKNRVAGEGSRR
jgi:sirohydrochlorin cobaltochelatase